MFTVTNGLTGQTFTCLSQAKAEELMDAIAVVLCAELAPEDRPNPLATLHRQWDNEG